MPNFSVVLIILSLAVVIVSFLRRIHLPPILGYLIAGALVGPFGLGLLESKEEIRYIAEFGVVFLLFSIGLELSLPKLISMRRALLGLGGMQVLLCTVVVLLTGRWVGLSWAAAFTISGALALSSTAVATKQLIEQDELHQPHGKLSLAILLFQDLAAVPFLIIVPALAGTGADNSVVHILMDRVVMGTVIFLMMLAAGRWLLRPVFHHIAGARSSELFMLTALLVVLSSAFLTEHYGLSAALGAFLAGVMLGETEYAHQIESDIQPFRDILLGLFFISVGLVVDPNVVINEWKWVIVVLTALIIFKTVVIAGLARLASTPPSTAIRTGLTLAQGSEFGLFLLAIAADKNIVDPNATQIVISSIVISMALSPLLIRKSEPISEWIIHLLRMKKVDDLQDISTPPKIQEDHVILCGFGRVGQTLARFLEQEAIPFVGLDIDPVRLREARAASEPVFFGDPSQEGVLEACGIKKARLVIIAFTHPKQTLKILNSARRLNREIPILVRTTDDSELESLQLAGATEVIPDKLESSLMLASHMLILLGQSPAKAQQLVKEVKANRYKLLRGFYEGENIGRLEADKERTYLHAVEITEGAYAVGHTVEDIMTEKGPFNLSSFSRGGFKCDLPTATTVIQAGDVLIIEGTKEEIYNAEEKLLQG